MKNIVIGTSGHIDHGKSTLVKALTGVDPDRWKEEKKRGITIDLGFAHYVWKDELQISFIDVPGHEKFVHNMLAGVSGVDLLLLIVAADESVMPQTREHLSICHLLGIQDGIIVITRCDLADAEMIELVEEEVRELASKTVLKDSPIVKVSSVTGEGLDNLKEVIAKKVMERKEIPPGKNFRLPVDRSFTVKGFGTVVTGTVIAGEYVLGDPLTLYPQEKEIRIRGLQVYGKTAETLKKGERAALNVSGIESTEILRGDQLCTKGFLVNSRIIDAELEILEEKKDAFKNRMQVLFYSGSREIKAKLIRYFKSNEDEKKRQFVQFRLDSALSCRYGDRFIIRSFSPLDTIGGGTILAPYGNRSRKNKGRLYESLCDLAASRGDNRILETLFLSGTSGMSLEKISPLVDMSDKNIKSSLQLLSSQGKILLLDSDRKKYLHIFHVNRIARFIRQVLEKYHQQFPEKAGAPKTEFAGKIARVAQPGEIAAILEWMTKNNLIVKEELNYRLPDFSGHLSKQQEVLKEKLIEALLKDPVQPPGLVNLADMVCVSKKEAEKSLKIGLGENWAVRVKEDIWFHKSAIDQVEDQLREFFQKSEQITVIEFKELLGISRKNAIALLEYFDSKHLTRRIEEYRILRLGSE